MALPPERAGFAAPVDLAVRRQGIAGAVASGIWATDPAAQEATLGGVRCLRFAPPGASAATLLHFHGGGFRQGCPEMVGPFAAALAARCGVTVICPAYRLAPEHPFPGAIVDAYAVMRALSGPLILSGDSAGGGIAAALALLAVEDGVTPLGLILLSAWLDLTVSNACYEDNGPSDPLFSRDAAQAAVALYLQGAAADDPIASPLFGDPSRFPPSLINAGTGEVLAADARGLHERLAGAGVPARLHLVAGMEHVAVTRGKDLPGAAETFGAVVDFVDGLIA